MTEPTDMNAEAIMRDCLERHGYHGLYSVDGECSCTIEDLAPCGFFSTECRPGHRVPCPQDCDCGKHIGARQ